MYLSSQAVRASDQPRLALPSLLALALTCSSSGRYDDLGRGLFVVANLQHSCALSLSFWPASGSRCSPRCCYWSMHESWYGLTLRNIFSLHSEPLRELASRLRLAVTLATNLPVLDLAATLLSAVCCGRFTQNCLVLKARSFALEEETESFSHVHGMSC